MKKQGFTLIETIVTLFIILILFSMSTSLGKVENNLYKGIESDGSIYEMQSFMTYTKLKCKDKNKEGRITLNSENDKMYFYNNFKKMEKTIQLPKSVKLIGCSRSLLISSKGKFKEATTISLRNGFESIENITIGAGVDTITIKDLEKET